MNDRHITYPRVLAIAGSDSGGGAGIQADIKTISATGSYAASAITAVTVQNTVGVRAVHNVPEEIVKGEIEEVLDDIGADAVKIGMLSTASLVRTVAETIEKYNIEKIVLDPVMVATSGDRLIDGDAVETLLDRLAPMALILTPNIPEAEVITGLKFPETDLETLARAVSDRVSRGERKVCVMMKGGHADAELMTDCFYDALKDEVKWLSAPRTLTENTHGTGCTLSSAIASFLAQGFTLEQAVRNAKSYLTRAVEEGAKYSIGHGHGPVKHFWNINNG